MSWFSVRYKNGKEVLVSGDVIKECDDRIGVFLYNRTMVASFSRDCVESIISMGYVYEDESSDIVDDDTEQKCPTCGAFDSVVVRGDGNRIRWCECNACLSRGAGVIREQENEISRDEIISAFYETRMPRKKNEQTQ